MINSWSKKTTFRLSPSYIYIYILFYCDRLLEIEQQHVFFFVFVFLIWVKKFNKMAYVMDLVLMMEWWSRVNIKIMNISNKIIIDNFDSIAAFSIKLDGPSKIKINVWYRCTLRNNNFCQKKINFVFISINTTICMFCNFVFFFPLQLQSFPKKKKKWSWW